MFLVRARAPQAECDIIAVPNLLVHANEQITRASYVVSAEQVDPITVDILDAVLRS